MIENSSYSNSVVQLFEEPNYVGILDVSDSDTYVVKVQESCYGAFLILSILLDNEIIKKILFKTRGCPYLIAGADWFCSDLEGKSYKNLKNWSAALLIDKLEVPTEKIGRILIIEDAARKLYKLLVD